MASATGDVVEGHAMGLLGTLVRILSRSHNNELNVLTNKVFVSYKTSACFNDSGI